MVYPTVFAMVCDNVFPMVYFEASVARHVPPSRRRYEERNPTLSLRLSTDEREKLLKMSASTGESLSSILRQGLLLVEASTEKAREEGYKEGHTKGLGMFRIVCSVCGKTVLMDSRVEKIRAVLDDAFREWGHGKCVRQQ